MLNIIPLIWNKRLVSVVFHSIVLSKVLNISWNIFTLNNNEQIMILQCLGLTLICYILWSPQLDHTQSGR